MQVPCNDDGDGGGGVDDATNDSYGGANAYDDDNFDGGVDDLMVWT